MKLEENKINNVNNDIPFKEKMKQHFIPIILEMVEKEEKYLEYLITNNYDEIMIETSRKTLNHFKQRYKEYNDYITSMY